MIKKISLNDKTISLARDPKLKQDKLQAWDAADEYVLNHLCDNPNSGLVLILNDAFGALGCGIKNEAVIYTDSCISEKAISNNLSLNGKDNCKIATTFENLPETVDHILLKLPKTVAQLEYQLQVLAAQYKNVPITAAGMVKYMPMTMIKLFEYYWPETKTSLAKKKARLIFSSTPETAPAPQNNYPVEYELESGIKTVNYPGIFSMDHLDMGTRFLIDNLPEKANGTIIDLGCGNGVLGVAAKLKNPEADIICTDESYSAARSAEATFKENGLETKVVVQNILETQEDSSVFAIVCNPPFHQNTGVSTDIALTMFKESHRVLIKGGLLFIVANKHLGYHKKLREIFRNLRKVAENDKFFVFSVRK